MPVNMVDPPYNEALARAILSALSGMRRRRARFNRNVGRFVMYVDVPGELKTVKVVVDVDRFSYTVKVVPLNQTSCLDAAKRRELAEACAEINVSLRDGRFELEPASGVVRYNTIVDADGYIPSRPRVAYSVASAIETTLRHGSELPIVASREV
ncbi:MAG: hypothetical protein IJL92_09840 [Thermoguttaceae bacterium]|nr:hypothetical protein [Thermoguttaceae bacterium]